MQRTHKYKEKLQQFVFKLTDEISQDGNWGEVAKYIPALSKVKLEQLEICIYLENGDIVSSTQSFTPFSIQSISKVFLLAMAQNKIGTDYWRKVRNESSGNAFDSIVQLEQENGIPRNPFINAGAIKTTDIILKKKSPENALDEILTFIRDAASNNEIFINEEVAQSEMNSGHKNYAIAHFMRAYGTLDNKTQTVLKTYFHQCSIEMTCKQLAMAGHIFIGKEHKTPHLSQSIIKNTNAIMMIAGHYNGSGDFAVRVGIPGKSGVGGGILAIVPNQASIAVWSPGLNEFGNSKVGTLALEKISNFMNWSLFS